MKNDTIFVKDRVGDVVVGAEVYIRKQSDDTLVTLYSDEGVTTTANPLTTDNDGRADFYAADNLLYAQIFVDGVQQGEDVLFQHYDNLDGEIAALRSVTSAADKGFYFTGSGTGDVFDLTADGRALGSYDTNGLMARTASATFTGRTITGTSNEVTVSNGDGVSGNPTLSLPTPIKTHTVELLVTDPNGDAITTGDGKAYYSVAAQLNGCNLVAAAGALTTASSSGAPSVQIHNVTQTADMLSTAITIDANELHSKDASTPAAIDAANDDVATGDLLRIDVDAAGTGAKGLIVVMEFRQP